MVNQNLPLGERVRLFRKNNGLSAIQFIKMLDRDLSPAFITKLEVHGDIPSPELICKIADVINYPAENLLKEARESKLKDYHKSLEKKHRDTLAWYRKQKAN